MLFLGLLSFLVAIPLFSYSITPSLFNRITSLLLLFSALLAFHSYSVECVASGVGIYSGLFQITSISLGMEAFLLVTACLLLLSWAPVGLNRSQPQVAEYGILVLFACLGQSFLISSSDLVSMYLSIELQSFAVYILATLYRDSESATSAGLKYFLLGGLSSALILLGTAIIYSYTGLTQLEGIFHLATTLGGEEGAGYPLQVPVLLGFVVIGVGLLFKVAAAPFHNWAPDVYDGVPTVVTSWLTTMPKISLFIFLLLLQNGLSNLDYLSILPVLGNNAWKYLLLTASLLSLLIGTVLGLSQYRIKRLLAYSTISHVGFLLLALSIQSEDSVEAFIFYLIQYSLTNVATFLVLLAFANYLYGTTPAVGLKPIGTTLLRDSRDVTSLRELAGQFQDNPLLSLSLAICLFSMAGIPPLLGFFAKQMVLYSSLHAGYYFLSIVAILVSVISASYYLKIVRILYFDALPTNSIDSVKTKRAEEMDQVFPRVVGSTQLKVTNVHSFVIATLTMVLTLFLLHPTVLLNGCHLLSLSLFSS